MQYAEFAPSPALAGAVRCYWTITGAPASSDAPVANRVLPDNCIDVIFDLRRTAAAHAFVVGPMLTAQVFLHGDAVDMLGVRFRPGAATAFLSLEAADLAPSDIRASDVWPDAGALTAEISEQTGAGRLQALDAYLLRRRRENTVAEFARRVTDAIARARGRMTVESLSRATGTSERALQRAFASAVGITPKQVLKVQRFRSAASMIAAASPLPLSRIAAECGYADQSHLTRNFTTLAGVPPMTFRAERRLVGFVQD